MRDAVKSLVGLSWATLLFGARQAQNIFGASPGAGAAHAADPLFAVTRVVEGELSGQLRELFRTGDQMQQGLLDLLFGATTTDKSAPAGAQRGTFPPPRPAPRDADSKGLHSLPVLGPTPMVRLPDAERTDTRTHLVLGEGLAAGMGDFALIEDTQRFSFPNLLTQQMSVRFAQPLVEAPGLGATIGFPGFSTRVPALMQTTVLDRFPPGGAFSNLSVPGLKVADVLSMRPAPPLIHREDDKQTAVNLFFGLPDLFQSGDGLPTLLELTLRQKPSCVIVALGYFDFLEPVVKGDVGSLPGAADLAGHFDRILAALCEAGVEVLVLTVPDPTDTAYFSTPASAARFLCVQSAVLDRAYKLPPDCLVTVNGLLEIADQVLTGQLGPLRQPGVLGPEEVRTVRARIEATNAELGELARKHGALIYDLHGLFRRVRREGVRVGRRQLTADYLGGFYSLNGYYPGPTGHAVIAAELVGVVNAARLTAYRPPDLEAVIAADAVTSYQPARGRNLSWEEIVRSGAAVAPATATPRTSPESKDGHSMPPSDTTTEARGGAGAPLPLPSGITRLPLRLPPGLEQVLPLNKSRSYHGDGIRIAHCPGERVRQYGSCGNQLFGGLALFGSHLSGSLRFRFTPPTNGVTRFEIDWGDGLAGDDSVLSAPQFFRLPVTRVRVLHWPGAVLSGHLNLETGEVTDLDVRVVYRNSALEILAKGNPKFPQQPIQFPGAYGSALARFEQRPDGLLDFTFQGTTFIPLGGELGGDPVRWPLAFGALSGHPASVPAAGTALHPHLHLSTCPPPPTETEGTCPEIPFNTVQEYTVHARNSSFGDLFSLTGEELGGETRGRSHVVGRVQIQFGERFGNSVPVAIATLPPGGLLAAAVPSPLAEVFPGRLPGGLLGHDEFLRFPLRTYYLDSVSFIDDPFDQALGAVDLTTGAVRGELLHRGFIGQNLFHALVRVEPRTPKSSFLFRGPARFERSPGGQIVYRFNGVVHIPYPEGFKFPSPDLATAFLAGPESALDPFLRLQAMHGEQLPRSGLRGGADEVSASNGNRFSYRYAIPASPERERATFEYTNHTQGATFHMTGLAWVSFTRSRSSSSRPEPDTVTFTGYGTWSRGPEDRLHVVTVQVTTAREAPYVSIQIGGGRVSNVNTKPEEDESTWA
jgi:hypothetical protein